MDKFRSNISLVRGVLAVIKDAVMLLIAVIKLVNMASNYPAIRCSFVSSLES